MRRDLEFRKEGLCVRRASRLAAIPVRRARRHLSPARLQQGRSTLEPLSQTHSREVLADWTHEDQAITFDAWQQKFQEGRDYYLQAFELVDGVWRVRELGELQLEFLTLKPTTIDMHSEQRNSRVDGTAPLSFDLSGAR